MKTTQYRGATAARSPAYRTKWHTVCSAAVLLAAVQAMPAAADQLSDLKAQLQQMQQQIEQIEARQTHQNNLFEQAEKNSADAVAKSDAVKKASVGSFPGSFKIPGTNTSMKIGGYVKADFIYDIKQAVGDFPPGWRFTVDPADMAQKGHVRFDARQSRLGFETRTPTGMGEFKTYIEGDFYGDAGDTDQTTMNGTFFRIRQAYGQLGPVLAGQTTTNFAEFSAFPEVLDFNGPSGQTNLRQGQLRYTTPVGPAVVSVSAENPNGDLIGASGSNHLPDLTAKALFKFAKGSVSVQGVLREFNRDTRDGTGAGARTTITGWGLGSSGTINTVGKDRFQYVAIYGDGIGRYLQQAIYMSGGVDANGNLMTTKSYGGYVAYQHWWNDTLRSTAAVGASRMKNVAANLGGWATSAAEGGPSDLLKSFHGNLIWSPIAQVNLGVEYMWGYRERPVASENGGLNGSFNRLQASAQYNF